MESLETHCMDFLNIRYHIKFTCNLVKSFLQCNIPKVPVYVITFFRFIFQCILELYFNIFWSVHRISRIIKGNLLPFKFFQIAIKNFCVFLFLFCSQIKYFFNDIQAIFHCKLRCKSITVPCLALPCKRTH